MKIETTNSKTPVPTVKSKAEDFITSMNNKGIPLFDPQVLAKLKFQQNSERKNW